MEELNPLDLNEDCMRTLVLGPEEVREALDPRVHPKRHVFLVSVEGDVICCDLDAGWLRFSKPENVRNKDWSRALKAAISHMQHYVLLAKTIHDELLEITEPNIPRPAPQQERVKVVVFEKNED